MSDGNPQQLGLRSHSAPADGPRGLQFSLAGLFVVTTVMAVILATYFSVGRLLGMSSGEVLSEGLGRLAFGLPTMLVWIVGLTMAFRRLRRNRLAAVLTIVALGGLVLVGFVSHVAQMALIYSINSGRISSTVLSWSFAVIRIIWTLLNTACWILILAAIFARRPPDAPPGDERGRGENPFMTGES